MNCFEVLKKHNLVNNSVTDILNEPYKGMYKLWILRNHPDRNQGIAHPDAAVINQCRTEIRSGTYREPTQSASQSSSRPARSARSYPSSNTMPTDINIDNLGNPNDMFWSAVKFMRFKEGTDDMGRSGDYEDHLNEWLKRNYTLDEAIAMEGILYYHVGLLDYRYGNVIESLLKPRNIHISDSSWEYLRYYIVSLGFEKYTQILLDVDQLLLFIENNKYQSQGGNWFLKTYEGFHYAFPRISDDPSEWVPNYSFILHRFLQEIPPPSINTGEAPRVIDDRETNRQRVIDRFYQWANRIEYPELKRLILDNVDNLAFFRRQPEEGGTEYEQLAIRYLRHFYQKLNDIYRS